jgi:hypothetical protein
MGLSDMRDPTKLNVAGCIILPVSLFAALMLAGPGTAIWPKMAAPGAAIVCGSGTVAYESYGASYRPGEYTVSRELFCQTGEGKDAAREEITFKAVGVSFLIYAAILFLLLQFVARPIAARRWRRRLAEMGLATPPEAPQGSRFTGGAASGQRPDINAILAQVADAVRRGKADVTVQGVNYEETHGDETGGGDIAGRLAQLKVLRDQGLITAEDYEAKKAEILAGL